MNALLFFGFLTEKRDLQCDEADEVVDYHELRHKDFEGSFFFIDARAALVLILNLDLVLDIFLDVVVVLILICVVVLDLVLLKFELLHGNLIL